MTWLTPQTIPVPQQADYPTLGDFILAYTVHGDLVNASKFIAAMPDPQYANPQAYITSLVQNATDLPKFSYAFATPNPIASGLKAAMNGIALLTQIPVRQGDENAPSVYAAWLDPSLRVPGAVAPTPTGDGTNTETGQSAAPPGTIL